MHTYRFERALLPQGWAHNVAVTINDQGDIAAIDTDSSGAPLLSGCALPGVPNLQSHAHQRAMAGLAEYAGKAADSFWTWREVMYKHVNRITPDQLESIAAQLYVEMLKAGYTTVAEFQYLHHHVDGSPYPDIAEMSLRTCRAAATAGIAMTSLPVLYRFSDFDSRPALPEQLRFTNDADNYLRILSDIAQATEHDSNMSVGVAPHSLRAIDKPLLDEVLANSINDTHPIHIHIAEQTREVDACVAWSGLRPVQWLLSNYSVDDRWCLVHATHMDQPETVQLAQSGAVAGLCPTTEANLGDGIFNATVFLHHGGKFGWGSDSHISVDPVEEMRWFEYGQRLIHHARNVSSDQSRLSTGRFLFEQSVTGGAMACGRTTGRLEIGYRADLIVIDSDHPLLYGRQDDALLDSWIFSGNQNVVRDVFVGGRHVIQDGQHSDAERINADFKTAIDQLAGC